MINKTFTSTISFIASSSPSEAPLATAAVKGCSTPIMSFAQRISLPLSSDPESSLWLICFALKYSFNSSSMLACYLRSSFTTYHPILFSAILSFSFCHFELEIQPHQEDEWIFRWVPAEARKIHMNHTTCGAALTIFVPLAVLVIAIFRFQQTSIGHLFGVAFVVYGCHITTIQLIATSTAHWRHHRGCRMLCPWRIVFVFVVVVLEDGDFCRSRRVTVLVFL